MITAPRLRGAVCAATAGLGRLWPVAESLLCGAFPGELEGRTTRPDGATRPCGSARTGCQTAGPGRVSAGGRGGTRAAGRQGGWSARDRRCSTPRRRHTGPADGRWHLSVPVPAGRPGGPGRLLGAAGLTRVGRALPAGVASVWRADRHSRPGPGDRDGRGLGRSGRAGGRDS